MTDITALFALEAEQLFLEGKFDQAIELCRNGLKIYPDYPAAYSILTRSFLKLGDIPSAEAILAEGLMLFPKAVSLIEMKQAFNAGSEVAYTPPSYLNKSQSSSDKIVNVTESASNPIEVIDEEISTDDIDALFAAQSLETSDDSSASIELSPEDDDENIDFDALLKKEQNEVEIAQNSDIVDINSDTIPEGISIEEEFEQIIDDNIQTETLEIGFWKKLRTGDRGLTYSYSADNIELIPGLYDFVSSDILSDRINMNSSISSLSVISAPLPEILLSKDAPEDTFSLLAKKIENVKISPVREYQDFDLEEEVQEPTSENKVFTETIANILAMQGKFDEAAKVYRQLAVSNPEKAEILLEKANEMDLKAQIQS